jgi:hypothetical protein
VGSGNKATCVYVSGSISYEIMQHCFLDVWVMRRNVKTQLSGTEKTTMVSVGLRWNIARREFDY